jgi:hypothetical protein
MPGTRPGMTEKFTGMTEKFINPRATLSAA